MPKKEGTPVYTQIGERFSKPHQIKEESRISLV
jgi:hypothetical protein